jgi:hypothetical protein
VYLAYRALVVFTDNPHLVDAAIAYGFVIALPNSNKFSLLGAKHALDSHSVEIKLIKLNL